MSDHKHGDVVPGRPRLSDERGRELKMDDIPVAQATAADLQAYTGANKQLGQMQVPVLASKDRPNERLFVAVLDGTGNDMRDITKGAQTGVAQIHQEIQTQRLGGMTNVASGYVSGPGTQSYGWWDQARGHTFQERAELMYRQFIEQAAEWKKENPKADIRVAAIGFSRGAEEAAYFTRLVDERGIQDPTGAKYKTTHDNLITGVEYTKPPLVAPGQVKQAALLEDPVATGDPQRYDRRLPPSVVSALQITARDETRDQFIGSQHLRPGFSDNNRSLNITVPGAHSDIGDGYYANGLGIRNTNMAKQYLNGLVDNGSPMLTLRPEPQGQHKSNVIHDSERGLGNGWVYTRRGFDKDGVRDVTTQLVPQQYKTIYTTNGYHRLPIPLTEEQQQRQPMNPKLTEGLEYRALPIATPPEISATRADLMPQHIPASRSLADAGHPGNPLYKQALMGIETSPNIPPDSMNADQRTRVAAALTACAAEAPVPLGNISAVMLNNKADRVIAVDGDINNPAHKSTSVGLQQAMSASVQDCSDRTSTALNEQQGRTQQVAGVLQDAPAIAAHTR